MMLKCGPKRMTKSKSPNNPAPGRMGGMVGESPYKGRSNKPSARDALRRLEDITRLVSDWIWETDRDFNLVFISDRVMEILGRHPVEFTGKSLLELGTFTTSAGKRITPDRRSPFRDVPFEMTGREGETKCFLISGLPVFNLETGSYEGFRGTAEDITQRKRAEESIRRANEGLERRVEERTRELRNEINERKKAEKAAIIALGKAEAASNAKSEFLANVSHELRTPLNSIIGFAETMQEETFGKLGNRKYKEYSQIITESGQHLLKLINDILDVSKIEAGEMELDEEMVDVRQLIRDCKKMMHKKAEKAGVGLSSRVKADVTLIYGDQLRLKQILLNLVSNSIKFTPASGRVSIGVTKDEDGAVLFSVSDTGIGIDEKDRERILKPFGQARNIMNRPHDGIGLGLSLAKSFTELHGGKLSLESVIGRGTTITVAMPPNRTVNETQQT